MPKAIDVVDQKPKSTVRQELPKNLSVMDAKPKSYINDSAIEGYENYSWDLTSGMWMGSPFITYTNAETVTGSWPKGGRAG